MKPDRFLIGYTDSNSGFQNNVKPWLVPDNAFSTLEDAYVYRGRVRKKLGSTWSGTGQLGSRLAYEVATTDGSGNASANVPGTVFAIGQMFSIGSNIFTVTTAGTPATLLAHGTGTMTYNTSTGAFTVTGSAINTVVKFYPATPVMGMLQYFVPSTQSYANIVFDTQFSYKFNTVSNSWNALTSGTNTWTGTDNQFFWGIDYQGSDPNTNLLWVSNFNEADGIRYFNGTTWTTPTLTYDNALDPINSALLIIQFQNRLLFLNTIETVSGTPTNFFNRVRYSAFGNPLAANAFNQNVPGQGNFIDAPVQEAIVTAQFIKNHLIVYFTNSTLELVYTGNQVQPFIWQKIDTELGAESTFSEIPFDKQVFGVDKIGIHACNGSNVERIDENIPFLAFGLDSQVTGSSRIVGVRDYYNELVYWTYADANRSPTFYFPNKTLMYNYLNDSWAITNDSFTFFGYFQTTLLTEGATWGSTTTDWEELTQQWNATSDTQNVPNVRITMAGNQQGFIILLRSNVSSNCPQLQVTNIISTSPGILNLVCINHNLSLNDFVIISNMNGITFTDSSGNVLNRAIGRVSVDPLIENLPNALTLTLLDNNLEDITIAGMYTGGGVIARVNNINIVTKQYNFYTGADRNVYVSKIDFLVDATTNGQVTIDFLVSSSQNSLLSGSLNNGSLLGNNTLETYPYPLVPFEQFQDRLWHPLYFYAEGECVQFAINMTPQQMYNYTISSGGSPVYSALQDFQLHAMAIYAQPTSNRMQ